jgi:phosphoribosylformylglycinamidine (FGAM) synthase PurS component
MKFSVEIEIMPRKELLDPQGKTVTVGLHNIGFTSRISRMQQLSRMRLKKQTKPAENYLLI